MQNPRPLPPAPSKNTNEREASNIQQNVTINEAEQRRLRENNEVEVASNDEVFHPNTDTPAQVDVIETEEIKTEQEPPRNPNLRNRRVSYGKIPVPPMEVTVADIQEAAKQSREEGGDATVEVRKPIDPRRSSVSLEVFKSFRDPHDKKNIPPKNQTIYVEGANGKFREMKKGRFWNKEKFDSPIIEPDDSKDEESVIPYLLKAPGQAFRTQLVYNKISNIAQGFLAGFSVMLAIFSFVLQPDVLLTTYRYMSLPLQTFFLVAYSFGLVSAIDRTAIYEVEHFTSKSRLLATIYNNGLFTVIVWFVGLLSSLLCIQLESELVFAPLKTPSFSLTYNWRIYNVFRALTASLGFLLFAFKQDSDTLAKELKQAIYDQLELVTTDQERKQIILTAMKIQHN